MKLIIDIDKNVYTRLFDNGTDFCDTDDISAMAKAIRKGTPFEQIRAEIDKARFIDKNTKICKNALASGLEAVLQIIDKYTKGDKG